MNTKLPLTFRRGDLLAILLVVLLALGAIIAFTPRGAANESCAAQVFMDGKLMYELPLDVDTGLTLQGEYRNTVTVSGGEIFFSESDCPGGDCVHSGAISAPGRSLVCLPNRVEIRVVGEGDVDFVLR